MAVFAFKICEFASNVLEETALGLSGVPRRWCDSGFATTPYEVFSGYLTVVEQSVLGALVYSGYLRGLLDVSAFQPAQACSQLRHIWFSSVRHGSNQGMGIKHERWPSTCYA